MAFSANSSSSSTSPSLSHHPHRSPSSFNSLLSSLKASYHHLGLQASQDPLQFCADFFNSRLADERAKHSSLPLVKPPQHSPHHPDTQHNDHHHQDHYDNLDYQHQLDQRQDFNQPHPSLQQSHYSNHSSTPTCSANHSAAVAPVYAPISANYSSAYSSPQLSSTYHSDTIQEEDEHEVFESYPVPIIKTGPPPAKSSGTGVFKSTRFAVPMASSSEETPPALSFGNYGGFNPGGAGSLPAHVLGGQNPLPNNYNLNRRTSVSAESLQPTGSQDNWTPPFHPKAKDQLERLSKAVSANFLFTHLTEDQSTQVLGALQERSIPKAGIKVISQGDQGDYFYVVEQGRFDIFVNPSGKLENGPDGLGNKVTTVGPGGSFGELALMYNAPRAATVVSTETSLLWALDRVTFRKILMDSAFQRRRMYENFLSEVPLLSTLMPYERSKVADALETVKFPAGSVIIEEGEPGEDFFLLESGSAEVYKRGEQTCLKTYSKGDYFGELALLNNAPRAASVVAKTEVKVAKLGKDGFTRLLGNLEGIMRRADYSSSQVDPLNK